MKPEVKLPFGRHFFHAFWGGEGGDLMKRKNKERSRKIFQEVEKGHFEHFDLTIWALDSFADDILFHETCNLMASGTHVQEHPKTQPLVAIPPMLCSTLPTISICLSTPPIVEWPVSCFQSTVRHTSGLPTLTLQESNITTKSIPPTEQETQLALPLDMYYLQGGNQDVSNRIHHLLAIQWC